MNKVTIAFTTKIARGFNYEETGEKITAEFEILPDTNDYIRLPGTSALYHVVCRYYSPGSENVCITLMVSEDTSTYRTIEFVEEKAKREQEENERLLQFKEEEAKRRSAIEMTASQPPKKEPIPETDVFGRVIS